MALSLTGSGAKQQPSFRLTVSIRLEKYNSSMLCWIFYLSLQLVVGIAREKPNTTSKEEKNNWKGEQKSKCQPKKKAPNLSVKAQYQVFCRTQPTPPTHPLLFQAVSAQSSLSRKILTLTKLQASATVSTKKALKEDEKLIIKGSVSWQ